MRALITLHVFSGRPDPMFLLSDAQAEELKERLDRTESLLTLSRPAGVDGRLGYRGFSIEQLGPSVTARSLYVHSGVVDRGSHQLGTTDENSAIESLLIDFAEPHIDSDVLQHVRQELANPRPPIVTPLVEAECPQCRASDAPTYNPSLWNVPTTQPYNNCYNYANEHITNTFAQPGRAHGKPAAAWQCPNVSAAAQADGLRITPNFIGQLNPGQGWHVALVVWPNQDYHWYRQDTVGCWSHKPGQTAARNIDNSGNRIADPRTCNRGPYTDFCGYMITSRAVVIR
jgi:hypothetical protein